MTGRFSRGEAVAIFGVLFSCCLAFFLLGVYAGRTFFVPEATEPVSEAAPEPAATPPDLDFYSGLVPSGEEESKGAAQAPGEPGDSPSGQALAGIATDSPESAKTPVEVAAPASASPFWTVQVGALDTAAEARQVILRLEAKGYSARLVDPSEGGGAFHRVWVGEFQDEAAARRFEERLKGDGFHTYAKKIEGPGRSN